ncbi:Ion-translocating oxidoreductase complex subunit B [Sinobacterium norvegicum]|uniref:Ion-translocating oxidoreductase complex subunit B n=1 Tax=Sinobacterium norvegicum TaxID=1641715 RepID=A0ABN8EMZ2_9GAMM|nr:4Fe-4S binding protein [Sinobacterium norvegicum]CAH0992757.1 Ion-translocating oxidoreductase complex subunit B [Sinobacterium norvegicum]
MESHQIIVELQPPLNLVAPQVDYHSAGSVLVIGAEDSCAYIADALIRPPTILVTDKISCDDEEYIEGADKILQQHKVFRLELTRLTGYLGEFVAEVNTPEGMMNFAQISVSAAATSFDIVVDTGRNSVFEGVELLPPGYHYLPANEQGKIADEAITALSETVAEQEGVFSKPLYFRVNEELCGYQKAGSIGCTRCLDACAADAIGVVDQQVVTDPYLCHGQGACTSQCPTGAISFGYPSGHMLRGQWGQSLEGCCDEDGTVVEPPVLVITSCSSSEQPDLAAFAPSQPVVIQYIEEVVSIGLDSWLAALASGYRQIVIVDEELPQASRGVLTEQLNTCQTLLSAIGQPRERVSLVQDAQLLVVPHTIYQPLLMQDLAKRHLINTSLKQLEVEVGEIVSFSQGQPFGQVLCDGDNCTLCHACVTVCPTGAMAANPQAPQLLFTEADCIQCGLCEKNCPEHVLTLDPRFQPASALRQQTIVLKQEAPIHCIRCDKPFATESVISKMEKALANNSFFTGDALQRLRMCGDCKVRDIYPELIENPLDQLKL